MVAEHNTPYGPYASEDQYRDESDLKKYRTEIPNMIFDIGLTPYEVALYGHFKRVCGAEKGGVCGRASARSQKRRACPQGACLKPGLSLPAVGLSV
jgi:hypothetical protein